MEWDKETIDKIFKAWDERDKELYDAMSIINKDLCKHGIIAEFDWKKINENREKIIKLAREIKKGE